MTRQAVLDLFPSRIRAIAATVTTIVVAALLVAGVSAPASAVTGGSVSGTLTLANPGDLPTDFRVDFLPATPSGLPGLPPSVVPEPDGTFAITLPADHYLVQFVPTSTAMKAVYPSYYYPGSWSIAGATYVTVTDLVNTAISFSPTLGGFIEATSAFNATAVDPNIRFAFYDETGTVQVSGPRPIAVSYPGSVSGGWEPAHPVGMVGPVPPGRYRVWAQAATDPSSPLQWAAQYWNHSPSLKNAYIVSVAQNATTRGLSFTFDQFAAGSISGRVVDAAGNGIARAMVGAETSEGVISGLGKDFFTDSDGNFSILYLAPGDYTVAAWTFTPGRTGVSRYTYYPASATYAGAAPVTVTTGRARVGDIALATDRDVVNETGLFRFQGQTLAPASDTASLLSLLANRDVNIESTSDWGGHDKVSQAEDIKIDGLAWSGPNDAVVDVFGYSTATYLGTFAVSGGVLNLSIAAGSLAAGNHHLLVVGRSSGSLRAATITVTPAAAGSTATLPNTGVTAQPMVLVLALLLLLAGAVLVQFRRRVRRH
jgi:LPXTG-motif cell wall-anchored protein